ncbi:MAG: LacI family DNA-binding transcriptional regulator [Micropruina sp.]
MTDQGREPTLADVAERAGISLTSVSRVLNNRGYLSQQLRDRVAAAVEELQYRPNQVARSLVDQRTRIVGVIMPSVAFPFFGEITAEIENALAGVGYRMMLCNSFGRADREREYLSLLAGNRVDGIISGAHNRAIPEYDTLRLPLVTIDRELAPAIPNVRAENETGGRLACETLLRRGCRRPGLLTSTSGPLNRREAGYRAALAEAGIEAHVSTVEFHTAEPERTRQIYAALDASPELDGVFATDDLLAATVLAWAQDRGVDVPGAFRIIGFDGTQAIRRALPGLSTIVQPIAALGARAVELLLDQIDARVRGEAPVTGGPVLPEEWPVSVFEGWTTDPSAATRKER